MLEYDFGWDLKRLSFRQWRTVVCAAMHGGDKGVLIVSDSDCMLELK